MIVSSEIEDVGRLRDQLSATKYSPYELIVITSDSIVRPEGKEARFSKARGFFTLLNEAASAANGPVICFLDSSTIVKDDDWLSELVGIAIQEKTGAVGAKIIRADNRIKHAGLILGTLGGIGRAHFGSHKDDPGDFVRLHVTQNFSAVSADCMVIRKKLFDEVGGFDTHIFPDALADVDLCLRLMQNGYRNVWTPWSVVTQTSEPAEPSDKEIESLRSKWSGIFLRDPYYNPNFSNEDAAYRLASPPRK